MRLGRTAAFIFGTKLTRSLAGFLGTIYVARELGPDVLGIYSIAVAVMFWASIPSNAIGSAINKRISERLDSGGGILSAGISLNIIIALVISAIIYYLTDSINAYIGASVSGFIIFILIGNISIVTVTSTLQGQHRVRYAGVGRMIEEISRAIFQIALIILGYQISSVFLGHILSLFLASFISLLLLKRDIDIPTIRDFKAILQYAQYSWLGTLKGRVFGSLDVLVLGAFVSSSLIGIYQVAWNLASLLIMTSVAVEQTIFPEVSSLAANEEYEKIIHYLDESLVFVAIFAIPGLFGAIAIGGEVLQIYSSEFAQGATILVILIVAQIIFTFSSQFISVLNALGHPDIAFRLSLLFILSNSILNILIVPIFGWYGAAIATALSAFIALFTGYRSLTNIIGPLSIPYLTILSEVVMGAIMYVIVELVSRFVPDNTLSTIALVLIGCAIYLTGLVIISARIRTKVQSLLSLY